MTTCDEGTPTSSAGQVPSFVQVFNALLYSGIDSDALHVYLILLDHSWRTGFCWLSDRTIGGWLGKSQGTASRILKRLEDRQLIVRSQVEPSDENPTGRLITVNGRVKPYLKSEAGGASKRGRPPAPNLGHDLKLEEKKENGPAAAGRQPAPEQTQTIEEQIAEWRDLTQNPCASIARMAQRKLDELEATLDAEKPRLFDAS